MLNFFLDFVRRHKAEGKRVGRRIPGRFKVRDIAIPYRMGAGFPGDVNRSHPVSIEPCLIDSANPPTGTGQVVFGDPASGGVRAAVVGDTVPYGVTYRAFPTQQLTGGMNSTIGQGGYPASGVGDVVTLGYVLVPVNGQSAKFGQVYMWNAASAGAHVLGGLEAVATAGSTTPLAGWTFNSSPDATGIAEIKIKL